MTYCNYSNQAQFPFKLPSLPYKKDAFKPYFSAETFEYHHGMHHNTYVTNLNKLLVQEEKKMLKLDLEQVMQISYASNNGVIFNNAAQIWNHTFFWHSIRPNGGGKPTGNMLSKINEDFTSYDHFIKQFTQIALTQFGSGWIWLVLNTQDNTLKIKRTINADNPLTDGLQPIVNCDLWEHAYYIDFRNKKLDYISIFLDHMINWDFASINLNNAM